MDNNTNTILNNRQSSVSSTPTVKADSNTSAIPIQFDKELLDTLRARHNSRYSRSEAFIDILWRMREIDSASKSASGEQPSSQMHNSSSSTEPHPSVQQPSLFPEQQIPAGSTGATTDSHTPQSSPSYTGKPTDEFMSRHCITNYSQLAAAWHWNRQTVLTFLRSLESVGVILFEQKNKTVEIYI